MNDLLHCGKDNSRYPESTIETYRKTIGFLSSRSKFVCNYNNIGLDNSNWREFLEPVAIPILKQIVAKNPLSVLPTRKDIDALIRKNGMNAYDWEIDACIQNYNHILMNKCDSDIDSVPVADSVPAADSVPVADSVPAADSVTVVADSVTVVADSVTVVADVPVVAVIDEISYTPFRIYT